MLSEYVVAFAVIFLIDSISPGPAVATVVAKGATIGFKRTMPFIIGLVAGDLALFLLAVGGLFALALALGPLFSVVKWLGICYLIWLAWKMWSAPPKSVVLASVKGEGWRLLSFGLLMPFGNPKAIGFYVALLPTIIDVTQISVHIAVPFGLIIVFVWAAVLAGYALAAQRAGRLLTSERGQRWLNRTSAVTLIGVAGTAAART